jgi:hypothetical protein
MNNLSGIYSFCITPSTFSPCLLSHKNQLDSLFREIKTEFFHFLDWALEFPQNPLQQKSTSQVQIPLQSSVTVELGYSDSSREGQNVVSIAGVYYNRTGLTRKVPSNCSRKAKLYVHYNRNFLTTGVTIPEFHCISNNI